MPNQKNNAQLVVAEFYAALNRNDISGAISFFAPEILRIAWEGSPSEGVFRGLEEMKAHLIKGRSTWAEGGCTPKELIPAGDRIIAHVFVRVRLKDRLDWLEGRVTDVFTLRNGKISEFRSFMEKQKALDWLGSQQD